MAVQANGEANALANKSNSLEAEFAANLARMTDTQFRGFLFAVAALESSEGQENSALGRMIACNGSA